MNDSDRPGNQAVRGPHEPLLDLLEGRMTAGEAGSALSLVRLGGREREDTLFERLRRGEPAAIGHVYDQHHAQVRAFARRFLGEDAAAEDLLHEVFVALPSAMRRFQGGASLRTFLISIAIHHAQHQLRAASRRRAAMDRLAREPGSSPADPEREADRAGLGRALHRAMDELPVDQRVAFVLCEIEERSSREAGEITGVPEATIRTRLHHARLKLRAALEKEGFR